MNTEEKNLIRTNRRFIKDNVFNIDSLADKLFEKGILSQNHKELVASEPVHRRAYELLDIVVKRGPTAFRGLVDSLRETENEIVADRLEGKAESTTNTKYSNFPVKVYSKNEKPEKSSPESVKTSGETERTQSSFGAPFGGLPLGSKHLQPTLVKDNLSYVEWMNDVELTKLEENLIKTEAEFVTEMKKLHGESMYNMTGDKSKRGKCLMIDNIPNDFCHQGECHTIVDASKTLIQQTIKRCGFKWVNYSRNSGTAQTIKQKIAQEMKKLDHDQYSSFFVICITTGPDPRYVYGKDGENDHVPIQELKDMMSQCDEFGSKPKVLLVHTVPKSSLQCDHSPRSDDTQGQRLSDSMKFLTLEGEGNILSNERNMFVVSAELEPGTSFLVRVRGKTGCYFSNALVYVLLKYAGNRSFLDLMSEMDKLMESCEHENADNVDANPYNKRVPQRVRVARVKVITKPDKHLFLFPLYEDTGTQVSG
uniref:Uncharacterized protein LOC111137177 isoform X2 n=1 Tax=Crassostrea virginica TaxID=6565 RepID=A0A8B8EW45_CRAVI|nr:uncharacterized protein LOC111137177 isoform X2 [Crassostrea virginica]